LEVNILLPSISIMSGFLEPKAQLNTLEM